MPLERAYRRHPEDRNLRHALALSLERHDELDRALELVPSDDDRCEVHTRGLMLMRRDMAAAAALFRTLTDSNDVSVAHAAQENLVTSLFLSSDRTGADAAAERVLHADRHGRGAQVALLLAKLYGQIDEPSLARRWAEAALDARPIDEAIREEAKQLSDELLF